MKRQVTMLITALMALMVVQACGTQTPTASLPPTLATTESASPSATSTETETPTFTETPTPTLTLISTPTTTQVCPSLEATGQIVFSAVPCSETYFNCELDESSAANLYVINSDGTELRQLLTGGHLLAGLSLSPDGQKIAFIDSREDVQFWPFDSHIYIWDITTMEVKSLMADLPDESAPQPPQWFPDSRRLAYLSGLVDNRGTSLDGAPINLYTIAVDGTNRTQVLERPDHSHIQSVRISPDGSQIAFIGQEWDAGVPGRKIATYCINTDGSGLRKLMDLSNNAYQARLFWSHNGEKLFVEPRTDEMETLYVVEMKREEAGSPLPIPIVLPGLLSNWRATTDEAILELLVCEPGVGSSLWDFNLGDYQVKETFRIPGEACVSLDTWSSDGEWIVSGKQTQSLNILAMQSRCQYKILDEYYILDLIWLPENIELP